MSKPEEPKSEEMRTISPPHVKRERSEDEEPMRRVTQRTETTQETEEEVEAEVETEEEAEEEEEAKMIKNMVRDFLDSNRWTLR